ncbi:glycosyltransferase family 4 protein [Wenzhouxiangella sp. EGI_FJ10409]|uniref:glycosyltransferase family 4 protein n=1 Tax=Wenzhouxiangella sp. EGI_FJ10409 TaxID=3243767 RepID=UPI0035DA5A01
MLHSNITRRNGEAASFSDLTLALLAAGVEVSVLAQYCTGFEYRFGILRARASQRTGIPPGIVRKSPLPPISPPAGWRHAVGGLLDRMPLSGRQAGRKSLEGADVVLAKNLLSRDALSELRRITSAPVVFNHAGDLAAFEQYRLSEFRQSYPDGDLYSVVMDSYDHILCQSTEIVREIEETKPGLSGKLVCLTPSVDWKSIETARQAESPYPPGQRALVAIGSFQARKNQLGLLRGLKSMLRENEEVHLHFLGKPLEQEYYQECIRWVEKARLGDKVHFHGHKDNVLVYLANCQALFQVSFAEGFPRVVREAMALGIPVVSRPLPGMLGLLRPCRDFFSLHAGDQKEIHDAATAILEDATNTEKVVISARSLIEKHCSFKRYSIEADALMHKLSGCGGPVRL